MTLLKWKGSTVKQPNGELDNDLYMVLHFSFDAPIYYAKYEVAVPQGKYLNYKLTKLDDNLEKTTRDGHDFYKWEFHNLNKLMREELS